MVILNIVDNMSRVNFGIWNAAIATAPELKHHHHIETVLWYPSVNEVPVLASVRQRSFEKLSFHTIKKVLHEEGLTPDSTIVVTHGCWNFPTRWGAKMKKMGYHWVYVPHGMLEPWSLAQKKWKKKIYYRFFEGPLSGHADAIRAVGKPEWTNLVQHYKNVWLNPNGITSPKNAATYKWEHPDKLNYLFMARLHYKKGILPLVEAWLQSPQFNNGRCHLYIAGPDDGELSKIKEVLNRYPDMNITYLGGVYDDEKEALLNRCHVYLLPSQSEGFPTSVLEAMSNKLVTVITDGCNFPEAIESQKVYRTTSSQQGIVNTLKKLHQQSVANLAYFAQQSAEWVLENYSLAKIAKDQAEMYQKLLSKQ
jgi:glycosyltransferase involved in cell wall biosynthesis